jgi:hypothetical protein
MTWFYVDDELAFHQKAVAAGNGAMGLWVRAGSLSARQLSDGIMQITVVRGMGTRREIDALLRVGLWHATGHDCARCVDPGPDAYVFHDYGDIQPLKADVLDRRAKRAAAGAKGGRRSGQSRKASNGQATSEANASPLVPSALRTPDEANANPVPSPNPNPSLVTLVCRRLSRGTRATTTDDELELWRVTAGNADLDVELRAWLIHNADTDLRDPGAALLGWLRAAAKRAGQTAPGCRSCIRGWVPDEYGQPSEHRCTVCRPHLRPVEAS